MRDTGSPQQDVQSDFARERRRRALARIASRLRLEPDDVSAMLPFEEVVAALGRRSERDLGLQLITLDSIVGTVARRRDEFDRKFRPASTGVRGRWELPLKHHERIFRERIPLPPELHARIQLSDEWRYAQLAALIESWGLRRSYERERLLSRSEIAQAWFAEEYVPVLEVLHEAGVGGQGTEAERYLRIAMLRYLLLRTHEWTDEVIERLLGEVRSPSSADDTMVHQILKEMR